MATSSSFLKEVQIVPHTSAPKPHGLRSLPTEGDSDYTPPESLRVPFFIVCGRFCFGSGFSTRGANGNATFQIASPHRDGRTKTTKKKNIQKTMHSPMNDSTGPGGGQSGHGGGGKKPSRNIGSILEGTRQAYHNYSSCGSPLSPMLIRSCAMPGTRQNDRTQCPISMCFLARRSGVGGKSSAGRRKDWPRNQVCIGPLLAAWNEACKTSRYAILERSPKRSRPHRRNCSKVSAEN
jgi:hypothetical protein